MWQGVTYSISLIADYLNMSGLLVEISSALTGSGLTASDNGGTVLNPISPQHPLATLVHVLGVA